MHFDFEVTKNRWLRCSAWCERNEAEHPEHYGTMRNTTEQSGTLRNTPEHYGTLWNSATI
jgi:hypothetical protein